MPLDPTVTRLDSHPRLRMTPDGKLWFVRFTDAQRLEHVVLVVAFSMLAVTGLAQKFSTHDLALLLIEVMGGIEGMRYLHHFFAVVTIGQGIYHLATVAVMIGVRKQRGEMWPGWQDVRDAVQMVRFNLGLAPTRPRFGRYTFEEKMEYWAMVWGTLLMGITGFIMWFPTRATTWLPGEAVPISKAIHGWEAILAVLAILTWHMYNVAVKTFNKSIWTGCMSEEEMRHEHPLEYEAIMAARQAQQEAAKPPRKRKPRPAKAPAGEGGDAWPEERVVFTAPAAIELDADGKTRPGLPEAAN